MDTTRRNAMDIINGTEAQELEASMAHEYITESKQSFQFLKLPAEIRNIIHTYVIQGHTFDVTGPHVPRRSDREESPQFTLALLRTCRQISSETSVMVFALNTFWLEVHFDSGQLIGFKESSLDARSTTELHSIQSLHLLITTQSMGSSMAVSKILDTMPNLRTIQVESPPFTMLVRYDKADYGKVECSFTTNHPPLTWRPMLPGRSTMILVIAKEVIAWKPHGTFTLQRSERLATQITWHFVT